ncbi:MAG TPA: hypothetical protein VGK74_16030 [Symbiobacteriaceae bacterium]|jgi:hypothetical protein
MSHRLNAIVIGVLLLTNAVQGWLYYQRAVDAAGQADASARAVAGLVAGAGLDLGEATAAGSAPAPGALLSADRKLQTVFDNMVTLGHLRMTANPRAYRGYPGGHLAEMAGLIQGDIERMLLSRDYTELAQVRERLQRLAGELPDASRPGSGYVRLFEAAVTGLP